MRLFSSIIFERKKMDTSKMTLGQILNLSNKQIHLSDEQKLEITLKNLQKVYDELPILAEKTPFIKEDFNMRYYGVFNGKHKTESTTDMCNTYGCLLGNSARLFDLSDNEFYDINNNFDYYNFNTKTFPFLNKYDAHWSFLFSIEWSDCQPTFEQAMERVKYFLDKKGNIGEWRYQRESFKA